MRILSIDGGGIRGLIAARVLEHLEQETGRAIADGFDLISGTSTGGIIALGLVLPGTDGKPSPHAASKLVELYRSEGPHIFSRSPWHWIKTAGGWLGPAYPASGIEHALKTHFGDARLSETVKPVLIPAYDLKNRGPFFFRSSRARVDPSQDFLMREVARATAAGPSLLPPARVGPWALSDGGLFADNPALCALSEALTCGAKLDDCSVVSIGTGELTRDLSYERARRWGKLGWILCMFDVITDGVDDTVTQQLHALLGDDRVERLQTKLDNASDSMDDASPGNLDELEAEAEIVKNDQADALGRVCAALGN